jgi:hypothetical protein
MKRYLIFSFVLFLFYITKSSACKCDSKALTIVECRRFEEIFTCKINSITKCTNGKSIAQSTILETYKGNNSNQINFIFDCESSCMMSFEKDQTWLIYAIKNSSNQLEVNICDRNRLKFEKAEDDFYTTNAGLSFEAEINYLKKNIGLKLNKEVHEQNSIDITQRQNDQTSGMNKIFLLGISLLLFLVIYLLATKFLK